MKKITSLLIYFLLFTFASLDSENIELNLDRFEDERLVDFGKKIIFQEAPQVLPESVTKEIRRGIAKRILSTNKEKWTTCSDFYTECDHFRNEFEKEGNAEKLKFLDEINQFVENIQKKYEAA